MKILFIAPHLATGGPPQYLLKKIQALKKDYDIYLVEYFNADQHPSSIKKQLETILGDHLYTLGENKNELFNIIDKIQPKAIHLEEIPELFMAHSMAASLFENREGHYSIVQTTHSSQVDPLKLTFYPDKFVLVSAWSQQLFSSKIPNIPCYVWEYPILELDRNQASCQQQLGLDPTYKHVLMVGAFSEDKNQGEIFVVAKLLEPFKIQFHFVGRQAEDIKPYYERVASFKPDNCIVWGERDDVDAFYQACDIFYFSAKVELNPIVIKEALSYQLPSFFRRLHTYLDAYDDHPFVTYIDDNVLETKKKILETLKPTFRDNSVDR